MLDRHPISRVVLIAAVVSVSAMSAAEAALLWEGDPAKGRGVFKLVGNGNCADGTIEAVMDADPNRGLVWRYHKPAESNRCESHGIRVDGRNFVFENGQTYYLGWWSRLTSTANNNANFQWKSYGDGHIQNYPVVLKMIDGRMTLMQRQPGGVNTFLWSRPIAANGWNHYAMALKLSNELTGGYIEFWFNGVRQTFTTGSQRFDCRLFDSGNHNCPKWGVYGGTGRVMDNFVSGLKVGTTLADVLR